MRQKPSYSLWNQAFEGGVDGQFYHITCLIIGQRRTIV